MFSSHDITYTLRVHCDRAYKNYVILINFYWIGIFKLLKIPYHITHGNATHQVYLISHHTDTYYGLEVNDKDNRHFETQHSTYITH